MSALKDSQANLDEVIRIARTRYRQGHGAVLQHVLQSMQTGANDEAVVAALLERCGVHAVHSPDALAPVFSQWSLDMARRNRIVVAMSRDGRRWVASEDPWDESKLQRVARVLGGQSLVAAVTTQLMSLWLEETRTGIPRAGHGSASIYQADGPVVRFVDRALSEGFRGGASDVHFECHRDGVQVKHRLDGVMLAFATMEGAASAEEVVSRIKVLAKLDITERRIPQDGRFRFSVAGTDVDLRVSIMPSVHGEDAVLRLLDKAQLRGRSGSVSLDQLGFDPSSATAIRALAARPSGMSLVTGPTGSGKTTTVYAALSEINTGAEKLITIEDPVEYELTGVLQIPVNERKGLTFAKGLRSILRHDPDRILVGEIRDAETAGIAVQSALTGHLVFTTVHANTVADVIGRFRHFDLDMYGFVSALNGVVVQRLLRRLCAACASSATPSQPERLWLERQGVHGRANVPAPVGCPACHGSGFKGRFVVAEVHRLDDALREQIVASAPMSVLKAHAAGHGVASLLAQALEALGMGRTTIGEIRRVIGDE